MISLLKQIKQFTVKFKTSSTVLVQIDLLVRRTPKPLHCNRQIGRAHV